MKALFYFSCAALGTVAGMAGFFWWVDHGWQIWPKKRHAWE